MVTKFLNIDTDSSLTANSNERVPSQKAIKTYTDAIDTAKQNKTLTTPITVGTTEETTVEGALGSINTSLSTKQGQTLSSSITVAGTPQTTVEGALSAINTVAGSAVQPSDLATVATTGSYNDLLDKPTIPAGQVQSNWDESDESDVSYIQNKPILGTMATENAADYTKTANLANVGLSGDYDDLTNKPTIPAAQVQSDWDESDESDVAYIKNKPYIPSEVIVDQSYNASSTNAQSGTAVAQAISTKQDTLTAGNNITISSNVISAKDTTYIAGTGISITEDSDENLVISNTQTSAEWGNITGTLSNQTDLQTALSNKQDTLVSGTNIKTVNNTSLLGSGNINIESGLSPDNVTIIEDSDELTTIAVKDQKTTNADKFWTGTKSEYDAIVTKDSNTFYNITDDEPSPIIYAKTGFSNIDSTAKNIGNWSTNVTNCITEIPQNIKLELSNGTLTIKAGSKFYIPNGFESDGTTRKFDEYILPSDIVTNPTGSNRKAEYFLNDPKTGVERFGVGICFSGANAPSGFGTYAIWYDTANNIIKKTTDSGSTWSAGGISLPFGTFSETSAILVSIDQVFNGFGYMGNTIFAVPGVKGLIPNGRNADGSLKNNTFELSSVLLATRNISATSRPLCVNGNELLNYVNANYDDKLNFNIDNDGTNIEKAIIGSWSADSNGKITSIKTSKCFHALDYYDTERVSHLSSPDYDNYIQLSLGATGTEYIAPADGMFRLVMLLTPATYCFVNKTDWPGTVPDSNAIAGLYYPQNNTGAGGDFVFTWRVKTGDKFKIAYTGSLVAGSFMFIYNVGDSSTGN